MKRSATVGCALALVLLPVSATQAATPLDGYYGGASRDDVGGRFSPPNDVAVYAGDPSTPSDDKIFVVEADEEDRPANGRVQRLDRDGDFELMWGKDVVRPGAPGDTGRGYEICSRAADCKAGLHGDREGELLQATGLAVSQETGHVYVNDRANQRVQEFDLDGNFVRAWGWGVATGAPAFEICVSGCRAGRIDGPEGNHNAGQFGFSSGSAIAVRPRPPYDVWVADANNHRVMQFESDGDFLRAWGWGVQSGRPRLEACTALSGCGEGVLYGGEGGFSLSGYPRHLTVGPDGVVYGSDSTGPNRIMRFHPDRGVAAGDARAATLPPLPSIGGDERHPEAGLLSVGSTVGIEVDPASGHLFVVRDPFGSAPMVVDEVEDPNAPLSSGSPLGPKVTARYEMAEDAAVESLGVGYGGERLYLLSAASIPPGPGNPVVPCRLPSSAAGCDGVLVVPVAAGPLESTLGAPPMTTPPFYRWTGLASAG